MKNKHPRRLARAMTMNGMLVMLDILFTTGTNAKEKWIIIYK
jgi:hypothetical protein